MSAKMTKGAGILLALLAFLQAAGVIHLTPEMLQAIQTILGVGVVVGVHDAIERNGNGKQ